MHIEPQPQHAASVAHDTKRVHACSNVTAMVHAVAQSQAGVFLAVEPMTERQQDALEQTEVQVHYCNLPGVEVLGAWNVLVGRREAEWALLELVKRCPRSARDVELVLASAICSTNIYAWHRRSRQARS